LTRKHEFVPFDVFSFGLRPLSRFADRQKEIRKNLIEKLTKAKNELAQRLVSQPIAMSERVHTKLAQLYSDSMDRTSVSAIRTQLESLQDERSKIFVTAQGQIIAGMNNLRGELETVAEAKRKESVDGVLERISRTQAAVVAFSQKLQAYDEKLD